MMKMRKIMVFLVVSVCLQTIAFADIPEYYVKRNTEKIVIDGILDEADWKAAGK